MQQEKCFNFRTHCVDFAFEQASNYPMPSKPGFRSRLKGIFSRSDDASTSTSSRSQDAGIKQPDGLHGPASSSTLHTTSAPALPISTSSVPISLAERLWDRAYDDLKTEDVALIQAYEKILSSKLDAVAGSEQNVIAHNDTHARRNQMRQLIHDGLDKTAREARMKEAIGIAISARDTISSAIQAAPQAALAWTGICIALEIIQNPIAATKANREGIEYVTKRMNMYWELSNVVLKNHAGSGLSGIRRELEIQLIDLYKALLLYEIKSVCSYYRNRGSIFLRDIIGLDDWNGDMKAIIDAEHVFHDDFETFVKLETASDIKQLVTHAEMQSAAQITKEDQQCLRDLRLSDPSDDKKRIEQTKGGLLQEPYTWILKNPEYQQWRDSKEIRLLWIKGDPGKGKTMLLCGIINELRKQSSYGVSYFFCQATDEQLNNASATLRGLIFMLVKQQPSLISHLRKKYDEAGRKLFEGPNIWIALSDIFTAILQDPELKSTYLIVDALDECVSDSEKLLDLIVHASGTYSGVRWIVSSRNWPNIEERLRLAERKVQLSLELNAESISSAVGFYIEKKVHQLSDMKGYDEKTCSEIREFLFKNANDTFLWVALVCQSFVKYPRWKVLKMLNTFPPGLDSLYERMMKQIITMNDDGDVSLCKQILAVMMSVYRPITLQELGCLIKIPSELSADIEFVKEIVALCGSFLTIREDTIYFVHQSAKDHLSNNEYGIFPSGPNEVHHTIFSFSLRAMNTILRKNICDLPHPGSFITENSIGEPETDSLSSIRYSCVHWVDHLHYIYTSRMENVYRCDLDDDGIVLSFFQKHLLHWLEALSLLQHVPAGVVSITVLKALLAIQSPKGQLHSFLQDAHRFVLYHRRTIEIAPLQTYSSALIFSPINSLIRKTFHLDIPSWIEKKPIVRDNWSPCLQTLEGHTDWVNSVAVSADHKHIASGSNDNTIKIWDAATGVCIQTLKGHTDSVTSVVFLAHSEQLASGSGDKTIKIWNTTTGSCDKTLKGHTGSIWSVAVLANNRIVSASDDKTINIWDIVTSACVRTLEDHYDDITSVTILANAHIATGSSHGIIKIWDSSTGACIQTLKNHTDSVNCVASLNSQQVMAVVNDEKFKVWDISTGACVQTLEEYTGPLSSIAIIAPGQIASGSFNTVEIWDVARGTCVSSLKGHTDIISSIAIISPDQIVSGSNDTTVKIWDLAAIGTSERSLNDHSHFLYSAALSVDGKQVASISTNDTIKVRDVETAACVQTLYGHTDDVSSIFFLNHCLLASISWDRRIKIWNVDTGACVQTLRGRSVGISSMASSADDQYMACASFNEIEIWNLTTGERIQTLDHGNFVNTLAFSADALHLVSGSRDTDKISIWNVATGICTRTLQGHNSEITGVAFSSDGRYIASGSADSTVKIWDVAEETCLQILDVGSAAHRVSFDPTNHLIYSDIGTIDINLDRRSSANEPGNEPFLQRVAPRGYGVDKNHEWIMKDGRPLLWLPVEYRPYTSVFVGSSSFVGCISGRVLKMKFSDSGAET
ncbi:WD40-repeat-containing domain protein [Trichoderma velutinum]